MKQPGAGFNGYGVPSKYETAARTFASALAAGQWRALWIYFSAPPLGMLAAAELYLYFFGEQGVFCAKLDHPDDMPCIFCGYRAHSVLTNRLRGSDTWQATATTT